MSDKLQLIYNTLNLIEVKGHSNTGYLSSCMSAIQELIQEVNNYQNEESE